MTEPSLFAELLDLPDPAARAAFLDRACGADTALRERLDRLLARHQAVGRFLEDPPAADATRPFEPAAEAGPAEAVGAAVGPYTLREVVGEGGMGVVYAAEQRHPVRRKVALKVVKPGMDSKAVLARFEAERQALALMDHPHIAKVLDAGATDTGRPYFVMELVRGLPITAYCDQAKLSVSDRLRLFIDVCRGVQHAHQKGVIHRDLKPSNVLVTVVDGRPVPKVIDFGIAKAAGAMLTDRTLYTGHFQLVGTPLYMSPEQAELSGVDVDTRADVYSLGVVLYELLTGTTPFDPDALRTAGLDEVRRIIREDEPAQPSRRLTTLDAKASSTVAGRRRVDARRLARQFRGDLDRVVMTALEKDRDRRYDGPGSLAADVERYLADEPVLARRPSRLDRVRKWVRRHRSLVATLAVALAVVAVGAAAVGTAYAGQQQALAAEKEQARRGVEAELYHALMRQSAALRLARQPGYRAEVWANLRRAAALDTPARDPDAIREEVLRCLTDPVGLDPVPFPPADPVVAPGLPAEFRRLVRPGQYAVASPAGDLLAVADGRIGEGDGAAGGPAVHLADGRVTLLDRTGAVRATAVSPIGQVWTMAFAPDGRTLVAGGNGLVTWDVPALTRQSYTRGTWAFSVAVHPAGHLAAAIRGGGAGRAVEVYALGSTRLVASYPFPAGGNTVTWQATVRFSGDGERLLAFDRNGRPLVAWPVANTPEQRHLPGHQGGVAAVTFSPDGAVLATGGKDRTVRLWDVRTGGLLRTLELTDQVQAVAYSPDGRVLAAGCDFGELRLWDPATGRPLAPPAKVFGGGQIWKIAFDGSGRLLAAVGAGAKAGDPGAAVWAVRPADGQVRLEEVVALATPEARDMAFHPAGTDLVIRLFQSDSLVGYDLRKAAGPRVLRPLPPRQYGPPNLQFAPAGDRLMYESFERGTVVADWPGGLAPGAGPRAFTHRLSLAAVSPDWRWGHGGWMFPDTTWSGGNYDLAADRVASVGPWDFFDVWGTAISPDGTRLARGGADGRVVVWDLDRFRETMAGFGFDSPPTRVDPRAVPPAPRLADAEFEQLVERNRAARERVRAACERLPLAEREAAVEHAPDGGAAHAALALALAADPAPGRRDPARALTHARRATSLDPAAGRHWAVLGLAEYRAGDWKAAAAAAGRAGEPKGGADGPAELVLAMARWQQGDRTEARRLFDKAAGRPAGGAWDRVRAEAAALVGAGDRPPTGER